MMGVMWAVLRLCCLVLLCQISLQQKDRQSPSLVFVLRESQGRLHTTPISPPPAPRPPPGHHQWPMSPSPHGACDDSTTVELVYDLD